MIYVIHCDGYCKIGTTRNDPHLRLKQMQTGNPHELTLMAAIPGGEAVEVALHEEFANKRVRGEWFQLTHDDVISIALRFVPDAMPELHRPQPVGGVGPDDGDDEILDRTADQWAVGLHEDNLWLNDVLSDDAPIDLG
jgi:hypothetical protein